MSRINRIMKLKGDEREAQLRAYAEMLGCSLNKTYDANGIHDEPELIRRIREAERARRESRLWLYALLSAIASVASAAAAWYAVTKGVAQ